MLQHDERLHLPMQSIYALTDLNLYQTTKQQYLQDLDPNYGHKTTLQKWEILMARMKEHLSVETIPASVTVEHCRTRFDTFKAQRVATVGSHYAVTLEQCVEYFEDFYFIYTTEHASYQLRNAGKRSLIRSILESMNMCEVGINGRFYATLQENQKDTNWLSAELSKARCEALRRLGQEYTVSRHVNDALNIHVYDSLVAIANQDHFGIPIRAVVWDVFAPLLNRRELRDFFNQNKSFYFQEFEHHIETTLLTHIFSELTPVLHDLDQERWSTHSVPLSKENMHALSQFLTNYFPVIAEEAILSQFIEHEEHFDPDTKLYVYHMSLKSNPECEVVLRRLIRRKLIDDGYYTSVENLAALPADDPLRQQVRLHENISLDRLLAFQQALNNRNFSGILQRDAELIVSTYPDLLSYYLEKWPELIITAKSWIKSTIFIDKLLLILDAQLTTAIAAGQDGDITRLTALLITLIKPEFDYVAQLSPQTLNHPIVAKALLDEDGLFAMHVESVVLQQSTLRDGALAQYYFLSKEQFLANHPTMTEEAYDQQDIPTAERIRERHVLLVQHLMKTSPYIDTVTFMNWVRFINPRELQAIIIERQSMQLSPLPFCTGYNIAQSLLSFQACAGLLGHDWDEQGYLALRKKACGRPINRAKDAIYYFAKNCDWFTAFTQYQKSGMSSTKCLEQLQCFFKAFLKAMLGVIAICVLWQIVFLIVPSISAWIGVYFLQGWLLHLGFLIWDMIQPNRTVATLRVITYHLVFLDLDMCVIAATLTHFFLIVIGNALGTFLGIIPYAFQQMLHLFAHIMPVRSMPGETWTQKCDFIIQRLVMQEEPSALYKAELLQEIKQHFNDEPNPNDVALMQKRYDIQYQNRTYHVSFTDVARHRRNQENTFSLEPVSKTWCGLFPLRTDSEHLLSKLEERPALQMA